MVTSRELALGFGLILDFSTIVPKPNCLASETRTICYELPVHVMNALYCKLLPILLTFSDAMKSLNMNG